MRLASVVLIACVAGFAAPDSSADDAPTKADAPKLLRLALERGKTYLYRLQTTTTWRVSAGSPLGLSSLTTELTWDAGVTLQRVQPNGDIVVSLMTERVRGRMPRAAAVAGAITGLIPDERGAFRPVMVALDSDNAKSKLSCTMLGRGIRVRVSPTGRVLEATGPEALAPEPVAAGAAPGDALALMARGDARGFSVFAQQFFQELPVGRWGVGTSFEARRALAPRWLLIKDMLVCRPSDDAVEKTIVTKLAPGVVTASVRARGGGAPPVGDDGPPAAEWLVLGEVQVRCDTGLAQTRNAMYSITVPIGLSVGIEDGEQGAAGATKLSLLAEIKSVLDLVDVR
jgi:hypothetical protein